MGKIWRNNRIAQWVKIKAYYIFVNPYLGCQKLKLEILFYGTKNYYTHNAILCQASNLALYYFSVYIHYEPVSTKIN